jgi:hypothetical protein
MPACLIRIADRCRGHGGLVAEDVKAVLEHGFVSPAGDSLASQGNRVVTIDWRPLSLSGGDQD